MIGRFEEIPGYSGYRSVDDGTVWSCHKPGPSGSKNRPLVWRKLTQFPDQNGYMRTQLFTDDGRRKMVRVHQLILAAFVGPRPKGMDCRHLDGNRKNNRLDNLKWGTRAENIADTIRHGMMPRGERHWNSKLSEDAVREIRDLRKKGNSQYKIAAIFGVSRSTIKWVLTGGAWSHVA